MRSGFQDLLKSRPPTRREAFAFHTRFKNGALGQGEEASEKG